jgi:Flp pilus assembly pilin Flp
MSTVEYALLFVLILGGSAVLWKTLGTTLKAQLGASVTSYTTALTIP